MEFDWVRNSFMVIALVGVFMLGFWAGMGLRDKRA